MEDSMRKKLEQVLISKGKIKESIKNAGGNIKDSTPFNEYSTYIDDIYVGITTIKNESEMNSVLTDSNIGKIYRYMGESTQNYKKGQCYIVEEE